MDFSCFTPNVYATHPYATRFFETWNGMEWNEWGTFFQAESIYQPKYQHHARNHAFHGSYHCRFQPSSAPSCAFGTQGIQVETWRSHRASAEYRSVNWPMNCCTMTNRSNNSVMLMVTVFFFKGHIMITYMITSVELSRTLFSNLHGPTNIGLTEVWDNHGLEYINIYIYGYIWIYIYGTMLYHNFMVQTYSLVIVITWFVHVCTNHRRSFGTIRRIP